MRDPVVVGGRLRSEERFAEEMLRRVLARWCRATFGTRVRIGPSGDDGRVEVELRGHSERSLAAEVAGFGTWLEIVDPPEVRRHLAELGSDLAATYAHEAPATAPRATFP